MSYNITMKPINSIITKSPHFDAIMQKYEEVGSSYTNAKFFNEYVVKYDPSLKMRSWQNFMKKFNTGVTLKAQELIERVADKTVSTMQMEDNSLKKILAIADLSLDQIVENPNLLAAVPIGERMNWLFNSMKARSTRMVALTKVQQEKRKSSMYEDMLEGAQYGAIDAGEAEHSASIIAEPKKIAEIPVEKDKKQGKTVVFNPKDL
jgi:hypothetical protein